MLPNELKIGGKSLPAFAEDGYSVTRNRIWSKNTKRTSSGKMVGDIIARKYTISISWNDLTQAQVSLIAKAIDTSAFFSVEFADEYGNKRTAQFYSADPTYPVHVVRNGGALYSEVSIEIIER